jgi:hypothetical protein
MCADIVEGLYLSVKILEHDRDPTDVDYAIILMQRQFIQSARENPASQEHALPLPLHDPGGIIILWTNEGFHRVV